MIANIIFIIETNNIFLVIFNHKGAYRFQKAPSNWLWLTIARRRYASSATPDCCRSAHQCYSRSSPSTATRN